MSTVGFRWQMGIISHMRLAKGTMPFEHEDISASK
jgi:hypothetical protein